MEYFFGSFIFIIMMYLLVPVLIIGGIIYFIIYRKKGHFANPYLKIALSKDDALSQFFLLLATFFLGLSLFALNRDFNINLSWEWIFLLTSLVGLFFGYYYKAVVVLAFALIGTTIWWGIEAAKHIPSGVSPIGILVGMLLMIQIMYLFGRLHEISVKFKRVSMVYVLLTLIIVTFSLMIFSTELGLSGLGELLSGKMFFGSTFLSASLLIFIITIVAMFIWAITKKALIPVEAIGFVLVTILFSLPAFVSDPLLFITRGYYDIYSSGNNLSYTGLVLAVIYNLASFLEILCLILLGYLRKETWLINFGAIFLFFLVLIKYFDWFFFSLDKSLFFIGAGLILFLVGWSLERGRRLIISNIKTDNVQ